jgi:hypothetical protein
MGVRGSPRTCVVVVTQLVTRSTQGSAAASVVREAVVYDACASTTDAYRRSIEHEQIVFTARLV